MKSLRLTSRTSRALAASYCMEAPEGYVVSFAKEKRTDAQNRRMHSMVQDIANQVVWYGSKRSVTAWKRIFAAALLDHELIPGLEPGSLVLVEKRTRDMNIAQLGTMMELIEAFGAERGVVFRADAHLEEMAR